MGGWDGRPSPARWHKWCCSSRQRYGIRPFQYPWLLIEEGVDAISGGERRLHALNQSKQGGGWRKRLAEERTHRHERAHATGFAPASVVRVW